MKKRLLFLLLLFLLAGLSARKVSANTSLGVFPPITQIEAEAPANIESLLEIHNFSDQAVDLAIQLKPFTASETGDGQITYLNEVRGNDPLILQRVKIFDGNEEVRQITLASKQKRKLTIKIDLPKDEPPSDYYFSIIFLSQTDPADILNTSLSSAGIASNVLLSIGPKGETKAEIKEFSAPLFLTKGPVSFTLRVSNNSKHFITTRGEIIIKNMFGQKIGKVDLVPTNILSETTRSIENIKEASPSSEINQEQSKAYWPESFLLGPYTAELTISMAEEGPVFRRSINFIAFPVEVILGFFIVLIIIVIVVKKVRAKI